MEGGQGYNYEYDNYGGGDQPDLIKANSKFQPQNDYGYNNNNDNYAPSDNDGTYNQTYEHNNNFDYQQYDPQEEVANFGGNSAPADGGFIGKKQFKEDGYENELPSPGIIDRNDTMTAPAIANQFDESVEQDIDGVGFSDVAAAKNQAKGENGRQTITDSIKCNDGIMKLEIITQEVSGSGTKKHTQYHIKGFDSLGDIDIFRRYREFDCFREILFKRYPGLFIPPLPVKQSSGNKKDLFVEERQYFLDQFIRKVASTFYLAKTPELQIFLRPQGKCEESLKCLQRTNTDQVFMHFQRNIKITGFNQKEGQVGKYSQDISDFVKEQKVLMNHLKNFKQYITQIVPMKEQELKYYKQFTEFLTKYEQSQDKLALQNQNSTGQQIQVVKLIDGDSKAHLKNNLEELTNELKNPFKHIRNWIKGEMLGLAALIAAIAEKEQCVVRKQNAIKRLAGDREMNKKLGEGKFVLKNVFKGKNNKAKQQALILERIAQTERDIENWDTIKRFLTIYLAEIAIPDFRNSKIQKYIKGMQGFSKDELYNAQRHQKCWGDFYELTKEYNTEDW